MRKKALYEPPITELFGVQWEKTFCASTEANALADYSLLDINDSDWD